MLRNARFWRNVTIVAGAHIAIMTALARWNRETPRADLQSITWMSREVVAVKSTPRTEAASKAATPAAVSPAPSAEQDEPGLRSRAQSDIHLPQPTPSPTPVFTAPPKLLATHSPVPKASAKPIPKKADETKATPRPSPRKRATPAEAEKATEEARKEAPKVTPGARSIASEGSGSTETSAVAQPSEFQWYGKMLHDRFYREWIQPKTSVPAGARMSTLVKIRIESDGRISMFTIARPSGNVVVDESVAAVAKRVTHVDPLPKGLGGRAFYEVNINFELNPDQ